METTSQTNSFDAVEMMRGIRDKVTQETQGMSFQELQQYMKQRLIAAKEAKSVA